MKDVPAPAQPAPRRPIVLRQPGLGIAETPVDSAGMLIQGDAKVLQEQLAKYHLSLEQWAAAEVEWGQQRRLFQLMIDNVSDLIVLLDSHGNRTWNNPAFSHLLDHAVEDLAGKHGLNEVHPDDKERAAIALNETLSKGTTQQFEMRMQQKDGGWVNLHAETIGVLDPDGRIESVLLLASDMTEKAKLSEALALASTQATAANLVEGMARDFDQILTNVVGNLTIAKNLNGPHNAIAVRLNEIERALQRARDLIEQMFSISPDQAQPKVRISLENAVQGPVNEVLRGTFVRAEYLFSRNLPEVDIDEEAFSHAIRNIVTNSLQAMDRGVVRFTAESIPHTQFSYRADLPLKIGDYVCLHIQDQGHGIAEKAMSRVFEPYFTTRSGSQGLGLTTALSSIQRMGGTILVESTPGVGTTVSIYLPVGSDTAPVARPATGPLPTATGLLPMATSSHSAHTVPSLGSTGGMPKIVHKRRILLMDDEQMILDIVSRMLRHLGYDVTTCIDGSQAIAAFAKAKSQNEPFDVVMMDLVIPNGVGGQDAVHTIKKIDPAARVIASSGHLEHPVMQDHKRFGFNATLEKPYKLEKLQQVIEAVVNAPAA